MYIVHIYYSSDFLDILLLFHKVEEATFSFWLRTTQAFQKWFGEAVNNKERWREEGNQITRIFLGDIETFLYVYHYLPLILLFTLIS